MPSSLVTRTQDGWGRVQSAPNLDLPRNPGGYNIQRGILLPYFKGGTAQDIDKLLNQSVIFQFNPQEVTYSKQNRWGNWDRLGYAGQINFWNGGGPYMITFNLIMNFTASALYRNLRHPNATYNNSNKTNGEYINTDDFYNSGMGDEEMGLLPEIEKITAFQYPKMGDNQLVTFVNGMADLRGERQFFQPPFLIFNYGNVVVKCFMQSLQRVDKTYNQKLNPVHTEFDISLIVMEDEIIDTNLVLKPAQQKIMNFKNDWV